MSTKYMYIIRIVNTIYQYTNNYWYYYYYYYLYYQYINIHAYITLYIIIYNTMHACM